MRLIYCILLLFISWQTSAQSDNFIDSLKNLLHQETSLTKKSLLCLELSQVYLANMELDSCLAYSRRGQRLAKEDRNKLAEILNLEYEGQYYYHTAQYDIALGIFFRLIEVARNLYKFEVVARSSGMAGWVYIEIGNFELALEYFQTALKICKEWKILGEDRALNYYGIASSYSYQRSNINNNALARAYYDSAFNIDNGLMIRERALVLSESASISENKVNDNKGLAKLIIAKTWVCDEINQLDVCAYVYAEIAQYYLERGNLKKCREAAITSKGIYEQLPFNRKMTSVYATLAQVFYELGDLDRAFQMEHLKGVLADSIFHSQQVRIISELSASFEASEKDLKIRELNQSKITNEKEIQENRKSIIIISIASFLILLLTTLIFYNRYRYLRRIKEMEIRGKITEEKERISQDLHDNIGTQLTSIGLEIDQLARNIPDENQKVHSLRAGINAAMVELRDTIWIMNKEEVTIKDFGERIKSLFWRLQQQTSIEFISKFDEQLNAVVLKPEQAINLFRIVQEAISNSIKYSSASNLLLQINRSDEKNLKLVIKDNGVGFDLTSKKELEHYGLGNMHKRAKELKSNLKITTAPERGTEIEVVIQAG